VRRQVYSVCLHAVVMLTSFQIR